MKRFRRKKNNSGMEEKGKELCNYHDTCSHTMDGCTTFMTLIKRAQLKKTKKSKKEKKHTKQEVIILVEIIVEKILQK